MVIKQWKACFVDKVYFLCYSLSVSAASSTASTNLRFLCVERQNYFLNFPLPPLISWYIKGSCRESCIQSTWSQRIYLEPGDIGWGCAAAPQNPCPINDQNLRCSLSYFWSDQKFKILFMNWPYIKILFQTCVINGSLVQTNVKLL